MAKRHAYRHEGDRDLARKTRKAMRAGASILISKTSLGFDVYQLAGEPRGKDTLLGITEDAELARVLRLEAFEVAVGCEVAS